MGVGRWASLSAGAGEGHYQDRLFREWLWELPGETAGPAEWRKFGSPWGRPRRPSRMEHLHLKEPLEEGSTRGDSLSSQHQAGRKLRLRKGPQEEAGSVACPLCPVCVWMRPFYQQVTLFPSPGGWSWSYPIRAGIWERPPCLE